MHRYDEAIEAAKTDISNSKHIPVLLIQSHTAIGRCLAKTGRMDEAAASFEAAIDEAHRCRLPFMEMLASRDFIVHVLDKLGRRESQMGKLGRAISAMVLPPQEYTKLLGSGIDAEVAVMAFDEHGTS